MLTLNANQFHQKQKPEINPKKVIQSALTNCSSIRVYQFCKYQLFNYIGHIDQTFITNAMHDSVWLWRWLAMFAIQNELIFAKPNSVAGTWWILGWVEQYNVGCLHFSLFYCPVKFTAPRFLISFTFVSGFHLSCRTYPPIYSKVSPTKIDSLKVWICIQTFPKAQWNKCF